MDNYRGFKDTIIQIRQASFLVGENSTGKTSFLKLCRLLSTDGFLSQPARNFNDIAGMGRFKDIVSASSENKDNFRVGYIEYEDNEYSTTLLQFRNNDGAPDLHKYVSYDDGIFFHLKLSKKIRQYKIEEDTDRSKTINKKSIRDHVNDVISYLKNDSRGFKNVPKDIPPTIPIDFLFLVLAHKQKNKIPVKRPPLSRLDPISWIAPIRSRPERVYDGLTYNFSPEGQHTPFVLHKTLRSKTHSHEFIEQLRKFGQQSGLFETISAKSFGKETDSPFEIQIKLSSSNLNISNVGYGISQVLPLVVEFLSSKKTTHFAVQQPEVHLHPKAQAALGDLIYSAVSEKDHKFLIETHSDFLIDRFRHSIKSNNNNYIETQILFFSRNERGNTATPILIQPDGRYEENAPHEFRSFFLNESLRLLEL